MALDQMKDEMAFESSILKINCLNKNKGQFYSFDPIFAWKL